MEKIIKELSKHHSPILPIVINGCNFEALIDTGAYYGCVRQDVLHQFEKYPDGNHLIFSAVDGPVKKPFYNFTFNFEDSEKQFTETFSYMEWFNYPVILGTCFLSKCKFNYLGEENRFELLLP